MEDHQARYQCCNSLEEKWGRERGKEKGGWGGWGRRRGQGWWQCVSPEADGCVCVGCWCVRGCSPPWLPLTSDRGSPVWQSAARSVATVTEACTDQYKCVHEVKALPQHPYSPATHMLSVGYNPSSQRGIIKIEELQSKARVTIERMCFPKTMIHDSFTPPSLKLEWKMSLIHAFGENRTFKGDLFI